VLFTSLHWIAFLLAVFVVYHTAPPVSRRWIMLAGSIYFYASWSVPYLSLIGAQLLVDWTCGVLLSRTEDIRKRKLLVAASVVVNLSALCLFKYYGLIARSLASIGLAVPVLDLELPLAISFYTFESMSYTIDVYRRRLEPVKSPLHLALFITWFPHLVAGPIIRPSELVPQLRETTLVTRERFFSGLQLMLIGYGKKLLFADWLAKIVEPVFAEPGAYTSLELIIGVYAYAFQIYLDFSAYTDIARGTSRWFGIELPENFNAPYLAENITDFWRRWHMTLSHWLRDYLYIPLGGNKLGRFRTYFNLMLTMLLGGLWHGANWTFLAWGGLHGLYLAIERAFGVKPDVQHEGLARIVRQVWTFHLVCFAWVFFRMQTFALASEMLVGMTRGSFYITQEQLVPMVGTLLFIAAYWSIAPLRERFLAFTPGSGWARPLAYSAAIGVFIVGLMALGASTSEFIYFQF
jgi:alginate O-acetyltransferase complex protein AlgI